MMGCQASLSANADANASGEGTSADGSAELSRSAELSTRASSAAFARVDGADGDLPAERVLLGARQDLKLSSGKETARCQCLSVALGGAGSEGMAWTAAPPTIDDATQLAIALSSEGVECRDEPKGSRGASYWGYRVSGNDVIVLVEASRAGRPQTNGAIIPRPVGEGQVYVAPAVKRLPHGRGVGGEGSCKVGNPGGPRSGGFTELELGIDAPTPKAP
jgi:hypothetical protein